MKTFSIKINKEDWVVHLLSDESFDKIFSKDDEAITGYNSKTRSLYFRRSQIKLDTIIHEVSHAYLKNYVIDNVEGDTEEFICEFIAQKAIEIIKVSRSIQKKLREL